MFCTSPRMAFLGGVALTLLIGGCSSSEPRRRRENLPCRPKEAAVPAREAVAPEKKDAGV